MDGHRPEQEHGQAGMVICSAQSPHASLGTWLLVASLDLQHPFGSRRQPHGGLRPSFLLWWPPGPWGSPCMSLPADVQAPVGCRDAG